MDCLKTNSTKIKKDGVNSLCKICIHIECVKFTLNKLMNDYIKNRIKLDVKFRLIRNTRRKIHKALNGKLKSSSTKDILGIDHNTYKVWIEYQFTPEMNWSNIEIDHVKPVCLFDVPKDEELREAFKWKNTQTLLKMVNKKGTKYTFLGYQLQFKKTYQFIKINDQEGPN